MIERELTYLAKYLPEGFHDCRSKKILDIYIPKSAHHPVLRIRKDGDKYEMTKKQPIKHSDASQHIESTIPLTKEEFEELAKLEGKRVKKIRWLFPYKDRVAEIDVFQDGLNGLVIIDFEFETEKEMKDFSMPDFCLADITQENFAAGGMLCGKDYDDIREHLEKFGYRKIVP